MKRILPLAFSLLLLAFPGVAASKATPKKKAPAKPAGPQLPGEKFTLVTKDSWTLTGQYLPAKDGHLTFLMLHGVGSGKWEWSAFADRLMQNGYGVLAYDGRGHGESQMQTLSTGTVKMKWQKFASRGSNNEWNQMQTDVEAMLVYLSSAGVAPSSIAFAGASIGANVLLVAAANHPDVKLSVLLSPGMNYRDVLSVNPIRKYGKRPILVAAATTDGYAFQSSQLLYNIAVSVSGADKTLFLQTESGHGAPMLDNPAMMDAVLGWIQAEEAGQGFTYVAPSTTTAVPAAPAKP